MTVPIASITDTTPGVYKVTGPCSLSSPCPGPSCPTHGKGAHVEGVEEVLHELGIDRGVAS